MNSYLLWSGKTEKLRANVTNGQTFAGNWRKMDFAYILNLGRPLCETNHCIVSLAKYRFVSEKIDNN